MNTILSFTLDPKSGVPLDTADFYLQMEGRVTEINLKLPEAGDIDTLAREA